MAEILDGRKVANFKKAAIVRDVERMKAEGINPRLEIMLAGKKEDAVAYVRSAEKALAGCGIECGVNSYPENISQQEFIESMNELNKAPRVHGILIMRPLPPHIDWKTVENSIAPEKDVDGISPENLAGVFQGRKDVFHPCTAQAVMDVLDYYQVVTGGRRAVVLGRSLVVGKPVSMMLLGENATVTICHSKTVDLPAETAQADILVAAAGIPRLVKQFHVKDGAVVVDVGINLVDGKLVGDVDFDSVAPKAGMITPVPGGVGTVTTTILMEHVVAAAKKLNKFKL